MTGGETVTVLHPRVVHDKRPPVAVEVGDETHVLDDEGAFELSLDHREWIEGIASTYGVGVEEIADKCLTEKKDGEVCGRDLPCSYHSGEDHDQE